MPDIPGYVRYQRGAGHVQVAGLVRQLRFDSTSDAVEDTSIAGGGFNGTFVPPVAKIHKLLASSRSAKGPGAGPIQS
jgi:hypothetical protein